MQMLHVIISMAYFGWEAKLVPVYLIKNKNIWYDIKYSDNILTIIRETIELISPSAYFNLNYPNRVPMQGAKV